MGSLSILYFLSYYQEFAGELMKRRVSEFACRKNIFGRTLKTMGVHYWSVIFTAHQQVVQENGGMEV
jgi:hypothetical protein